jgi:hypothetical protein
MPGQQHCREKTHRKRKSQKREKLGLMADEGTETKRYGEKNNRPENREQYTERRGNQHDGTMSNWTHTFFLCRVATNASCIQKLRRNNSDDVHQARDYDRAEMPKECRRWFLCTQYYRSANRAQEMWHRIANRIIYSGTEIAMRRETASPWRQHISPELDENNTLPERKQTHTSPKKVQEKSFHTWRKH